MKYKEGVKKSLEKAGREDIEIEDNAEYGKSELEVQISSLNASVVKAKAAVRKAEKNFKESKYAMPFNLEGIDRAEHALNVAIKEQKSLEDDKKSREALLKELF